MVGLQRSISILFLIGLSTVSLGGAASVYEGVLGLDGQGTFPLDSPIGYMEDPSQPSHPAISSAYIAMNDFYRPDWFKRYVHPSAVFALNKLHGKRLSLTLPATIAFGKAKVHSDQVFLPTLIYRTGGEFEVWDLFLTQDSDGNWLIHSITLP
jgi:hypothetical protein